MLVLQGLFEKIPFHFLFLCFLLYKLFWDFLGFVFGWFTLVMMLFWVLENENVLAVFTFCNLIKLPMFVF